MDPAFLLEGRVDTARATERERERERERARERERERERECGSLSISLSNRDRVRKKWWREGRRDMRERKEVNMEVSGRE